MGIDEEFIKLGLAAYNDLEREAEREAKAEKRSNEDESSHEYNPLDANKEPDYEKNSFFDEKEYRTEAELYNHLRFTYSREPSEEESYDDDDD